MKKLLKLPTWRSGANFVSSYHKIQVDSPVEALGHVPHQVVHCCVVLILTTGNSKLTVANDRMSYIRPTVHVHVNQLQR